jgi:outer membrane PBP1 activator LpoA protein
MLSSIFTNVTQYGHFMRKNTVILYFALLGSVLLTSCGTTNMFNTHMFDHKSSTTETYEARSNTPSSTIENPDFWQGNPETIWAKLQQTPLDKLIASQNTGNANDAGWVKLAIISKRNSMNTKQLVSELTAWHNQYPNNPGNQILPSDATLGNLANTAPPKHIALLLPLSGKFASLGNATRSGFMSAYNEEAAKTGYTQDIAFYDTNNNPNMASLYQEAVSKGANIVVGPLTKDDVKQLTNSSFSVPTIALNYSDTWGSLPNNLYEFGLSPHDEAKQVADKASETGHSRALIIAPQSEWGQSVVKTLTARWQSDGGTVVDVYYFTPQSNLSSDIPRFLHIDSKQDRDKSRDQTDRATLEQQRRQDFDVVFLLAAPQPARQIVPLLRYYYVDKTAIYATSVVYSGAPQPQKDMDLNGVNFCEIPWSLSRYGNASSDTEAGTNRLYAVGRDAYLISHDLDRFTALPNFPLYGATGAITLTPQKQFYRRLAWTQFHNGQP